MAATADPFLTSPNKSRDPLMSGAESVLSRSSNPSGLSSVPDQPMSSCSPSNQPDSEYLRELADLLEQDLDPAEEGSPDTTAIKDMLHQLKDNKKQAAVQDGDVSSSGQSVLPTHVAPMVLEALDGFLFVVNSEGWVAYVSQNVFKYLRLSQSQIINKSIFNFISPGDHEAFSNLLPDSMGWNLWQGSESQRERRSHTFFCRFLMHEEEGSGSCSNHSSPMGVSSTGTARPEIRFQVSSISTEGGADLHREEDDFLSSLNTDTGAILVCVARRTTEKCSTPVNGGTQSLDSSLVTSPPPSQSPNTSPRFTITCSKRGEIQSIDNVDESLERLLPRSLVGRPLFALARQPDSLMIRQLLDSSADSSSGKFQLYLSNQCLTLQALSRRAEMDSVKIQCTVIARSEAGSSNFLSSNREVDAAPITSSSPLAVDTTSLVGNGTPSSATKALTDTKEAQSPFFPHPSPQSVPSHLPHPSPQTRLPPHRSSSVSSVDHAVPKPPHLGLNLGPMGAPPTSLPGTSTTDNGRVNSSIASAPATPQDWLSTSQSSNGSLHSSLRGTASPYTVFSPSSQQGHPKLVGANQPKRLPNPLMSHQPPKQSPASLSHHQQDIQGPPSMQSSIQPGQIHCDNGNIDHMSQVNFQTQPNDPLSDLVSTLITNTPSPSAASAPGAMLSPGSAGQVTSPYFTGGNPPSAGGNDFASLPIDDVKSPYGSPMGLPPQQQINRGPHPAYYQAQGTLQPPVGTPQSPSYAFYPATGQGNPYPSFATQGLSPHQGNPALYHPYSYPQGAGGSSGTTAKGKPRKARAKPGTAKTKTTTPKTPRKTKKQTEKQKQQEAQQQAQQQQQQQQQMQSPGPMMGPQGQMSYMATDSGPMNRGGFQQHQLPNVSILGQGMGGQQQHIRMIPQPPNGSKPVMVGSRMGQYSSQMGPPQGDYNMPPMGGPPQGNGKQTMVEHNNAILKELLRSSDQDSHHIQGSLQHQLQQQQPPISMSQHMSMSPNVQQQQQPKLLPQLLKEDEQSSPTISSSCIGEVSSSIGNALGTPSPTGPKRRLSSSSTTPPNNQHQLSPQNPAVAAGSGGNSVLVQLLQNNPNIPHTLPTSIASTPLDKLERENKNRPDRHRVVNSLSVTDGLFPRGPRGPNQQSPGMGQGQPGQQLPSMGGPMRPPGQIDMQSPQQFRGPQQFESPGGLHLQQSSYSLSGPSAIQNPSLLPPVPTPRTKKKGNAASSSNNNNSSGANNSESGQSRPTKGQLPPPILTSKLNSPSQAPLSAPPYPSGAGPGDSNSQSSGYIQKTPVSGLGSPYGMSPYGGPQNGNPGMQFRGARGMPQFSFDGNGGLPQGQQQQQQMWTQQLPGGSTLIRTTGPTMIDPATGVRYMSTPSQNELMQIRQSMNQQQRQSGGPQSINSIDRRAISADYAGPYPSSSMENFGSPRMPGFHSPVQSSPMDTSEHQQQFLNSFELQQQQHFVRQASAPVGNNFDQQSAFPNTQGMNNGMGLLQGGGHHPMGGGQHMFPVEPSWVDGLGTGVDLDDESQVTNIYRQYLS